MEVVTFISTIIQTICSVAGVIGIFWVLPSKFSKGYRDFMNKHFFNVDRFLKGKIERNNIKWPDD